MPQGPASGPTAPVRRAPAAPAAVVLFGASWCGACRLAQAYLVRSGIAYTEVDIDAPAGRPAYAAAGGGGVPLLVAYGDRLQGYSELAYDYFFARHR